MDPAHLVQQMITAVRAERDAVRTELSRYGERTAVRLTRGRRVHSEPGALTYEFRCELEYLIPDGTRTMPMPGLFRILDEAVGPRAAALDFLVALGTHAPMSDAQLSELVGRTVVDGRAGDRRVINHRWDDPASFAMLGTIPAAEIEELTGGRLRHGVPVALNKLSLEYDHVLVCGPVFPHEVVGFSGGTNEGSYGSDGSQRTPK